MIVREEGDDLVLVRQADHSLLSGWLAAAWGGGPWSVPQPYDSAVVAARLHDLAWTPFDEALPRRPDGRPYAFHEVSRAVTTQLYGRGIDAVEAIDRYAGLLTSLHFTGFLTSHWGWLHSSRPTRLTEEEEAAVELFLNKEHTRQRRLRDRLGIDGDQGGGVDPGPPGRRPSGGILPSEQDRRLMCNYFWLQLWDRISLDVCRHGFSGWSADYPAVPVSPAPKAETVALHIQLDPDGICRLAPYPLIATPLRARVPATRVPRTAGPDGLTELWRSDCAGSIDVCFQPRSGS